LSSAELWDPITGTWSSTGKMHDRRASDISATLPSGRVLVAGGFSFIGYLTSAEVYQP
jgi:hypothetical protein